MKAYVLKTSNNLYFMQDFDYDGLTDNISEAAIWSLDSKPTDEDILYHEECIQDTYDNFKLQIQTIEITEI